MRDPRAENLAKILVPLIDYVAQGSTTPYATEEGLKTIAQMSHDDIRELFVKYIGAGGVAMGGMMSLLRSMPEIFSSFRHSLRGYRSAGGAPTDRTDRDLGFVVILGGSAASIALVAAFFRIGWEGALMCLVCFIRAHYMRIEVDIFDPADRRKLRMTENVI